jgi:hypothetical protein
MSGKPKIVGSFSMAINEPDDAIVGVQATGLSCYPEAKATVGEPHLLLADRRLDWHRAHHEGGISPSLG